MAKERGQGILGELFREQERWGGSLPFREFMRMALYHEEFGYYSQKIRGIGEGGDFTTVPEVSPVLARAIYQWSRKVREEYPGLRCAPVIEIGGGTGAMAAAFLRREGWRRLLRWWGEEYWVVDSSFPLGEMQGKRVGGGKFRRFRTVEEALEAAGGKAILFSNELVDAFPCSVWEMREDGWKEVGVRVEEEKVWEVLREGEVPDSLVFAEGEFAVGQRVETHEAWRDWLFGWTGRVEEAVMLTIDYGWRGCEREKRRGMGGSLRAYWRQGCYRGGGVYARFGKQDLTADVNFSDVVRWSEAGGWKSGEPILLADFLGRWGEKKQGEGEEEQRLRDEADAGGAFLVCESVFQKI